MSRIRSAAVLAVTAAGVLAFPFAASAKVTGPAFYVDGVTYRTVATPTDLSGTGAPAHSYDIIYDLGGVQLNVAEAAPGDTDFNGGRWAVHPVAFPNGYDAALTSGDLDGNGVLDSAEEVLAAATAGDATVLDAVTYFVCTVNRYPGA